MASQQEKFDDWMKQGKSLGLSDEKLAKYIEDCYARETRLLEREIEKQKLEREERMQRGER